MSKLGQFCDRFIEAAWLAALTLVPLYINFFSTRGFSPGKVYLLRVIVALMAGAWLMKLVEGWSYGSVRKDLASLWKNPLALPVAAYVLVLLLTNATSVAPTLSFLGSFLWLQGTYTTLTYIALFFLIATNLRTSEQFDRIISVLLLSSIPIALYAVIQELSWDPLTYSGPAAVIRWRARSTMGNHIFLGAYLIMLMPLTGARLIEAAQRWREGAPAGASAARTVLLGAGSILAQNLLLAALLVFGNENRQLWWMMLPVLLSYLFLAVWTSRLRHQNPAPAMVAGYVSLLALQFIAVAFSQARGPWLGALAGAGLFGLLLSLRWGMRRVLVGVVGGMALVALFITVLNIPRGPFEPLKRYALLNRLGRIADFQEGAVRDRLLLWRAVGQLIWRHPNIGPSPDLLAGIRPVIGYGPETLQLTVEKLLPPQLGGAWIVNSHAHNVFLHHLAESGLLGVSAFFLLLVAFYRMTLRALCRSQDRARQLLLLALIAAMTGHLVELQFGLVVTPTEMLFWVFLALGLLLAQPLPSEPTGGFQEIRPWWRSWTVAYILLTLFLTGAVFFLVKVQAVHTGLLLGFGGMLAGISLLALELGPLVGEQKAHWQNWWKHAIVIGVMALLLFYTGIRPVAADAFFFLGQTPDTMQALLHYQRAAALERDEDTYYFGLGNRIVRVANVWVHGSGGKMPQGFFPSAILARTLAPQAMIKLGCEGVLGLAEVSFQEAHRLQPLRSRHLFYLAILNHTQGLRRRPERLNIALHYYQEAQALSPNRLPVLVDMAMVYLAKNQPLQALEVIQAAQSLGHKSWLIHYALARIYSTMGEGEKALKEVETVAGDSRSRFKGQVQLLLRNLKRRPGPVSVDEGPDDWRCDD